MSVRNEARREGLHASPALTADNQASSRPDVLCGDLRGRVTRW